MGGSDGERRQDERAAERKHLAELHFYSPEMVDSARAPSGWFKNLNTS
jgi:hypothetical protein